MQTLAAMAGIQPDVFWKLTYRDLHNWIEGYGRKNTEEWRMARLQSWMVYAANTDAKDRKSITEWLPLPGDVKEKPRKLISKAQWEFMKANWN